MRGKESANLQQKEEQSKIVLTFKDFKTSRTPFLVNCKVLSLTPK